MALKSFNPYTASRRFVTMLDKSEITKQTPEKSLVEPKKRTGGRNAHGEITIWHRGGGHKKQYRAIDFRREKNGDSGARRGHRVRPEPFGAPGAAALCRRREALHPASDRPRSGDDGADRRRRGHSAGKRDADPVHPARNAVAQPGTAAGQGRTGGARGGRLGAVAQQRGRYRAGQAAFGRGSEVCVWIAWPPSGRSGNLDHENVTYGKAGRTRWHGRRPTVRGVAMNPVDHPHGGGEGRVKGNHPQTPWGFPTLGAKTRRNRRSDKQIVQRRKP